MYGRILDGVVFPKNFAAQIQAGCSLVTKMDVKFLIRSNDRSGGRMTVFLVNAGGVGGLFEDLFTPKNSAVGFIQGKGSQ